MFEIKQTQENSPPPITTVVQKWVLGQRLDGNETLRLLDDDMIDLCVNKTIYRLSKAVDRATVSHINGMLKNFTLNNETLAVPLD